MKKLIKKIGFLVFAAFLCIANLTFGQANIILDGGFEGGTPSAAWTEYSTNFGTPLCNLAVCGTGTGTGPRTGDWYVWFGGMTSGIEECWVAQTITIPTGNSAVLLFYLEQIVCDSPQDFLEIIIDSTDTVYHTDGSSPLCGQLGYTLQAVSLSAYADGLPHEIKFLSITYSNGGGPTNFYMDDVSMIVDANSISGKLFIDLNSNNIQDGNEMSVTSKKVNETVTGNVGFTWQSGQYTVFVFDTGNFTVSPDPMIYFNVVPASHAAYFSGTNQIDSLNDFAYQPAGVFNDLCVTITPIANFRPGFNAYYMINYENVGTTALNGTVIFFPDNDVTFVSANPAATSVTTDSIVWNVGTLTPFQTGSILVTVNVNVGTPIGTLINSNVRIEPVAGDNYPGCNYAYWEVLTTGSFDPNIILVDRDTILTTELLSPPYLEYIIWFQNTGNDTAFNVKVLNNIPQMLDVNSFEFVAASHPVTIEDISFQGNLEFRFDNILLADSNINEPESHGFIRYRIKPKTTLVAGDLINNTAFIYFDFNAPVQTNTAVTEIVLPTGEESFGFQVSGLWLYPNPAKDELIVNGRQLKEKGIVRVFDLFGREVYQLETRNQEPETKIDVSGFSQGVYIIEMREGEKVLRGKFVRE